MTTTVKPPLSLYERDFAAWLEEQASLLRTGQFDALDAGNLAEELEDMGRSQRRELDSRLTVLVAHLLKVQRQPELHSRSWDLTIAQQRREIQKLLQHSPSLRKALPQVMAEAYAAARKLASLETGLPEESFPPALDRSIEAALELSD